MSDQIIRGAEVNRPSITALSSSVLDHATVVTNDRNFGLRNNHGLWVSYNCLDLIVPTPMCPDVFSDTDFKTFVNGGWVPGFEFAVHGGVKCLAVGLDKADQESEVKRVFELSEGKGVEQALLTTRFVESDPAGAPIPSLAPWDAPVDLSDALGPVPLLAAFAVLEGYAATVYAGVPTIHAPRSAVLMAMALGAVVERDGKFYTKTGAKVACGGGYDEPDADGLSNEVTLYATGEVYVERSETLEFRSIVLPGDGSGVNDPLNNDFRNNLSDNTVINLVERMYRVGVDCFTAQITATMWGAVTPPNGGGGDLD